VSVVQSGATVCVRCGFPIVPGAPWHLDHADDKLHYRGPAHARCNLEAAARLGNQRMREKQAEDTSLGWVRASREW
jgi:hypothetical protein